MKAIRLSDSAAGLLALACAGVVVLGTALEAEARLGPAGSAPVVAAPPAPAVAPR
jgi:hypothetical protein